MKNLLTLTMSSVFAVSAFVAVSVVSPRIATAAPTSNTVAQATQKPATKSAAYSYVAQPDDTYSQMVRKAIQTYGKTNKVKLSNAKIIAAETNITQDDGSPLLTLGQKVDIKESSVKAWVEKVQKLTVAQEAAWNAYTVGVDFNTNNIGEAK
jgi:hypothetical protein